MKRKAHLEVKTCRKRAKLGHIMRCIFLDRHKQNKARLLSESNLTGSSQFAISKAMLSGNFKGII